MSRRWGFRIAIALLAAAGTFWGWRSLRPSELPEGFARSNGRIEATEIDVAAKIAGRIDEILVDEGDFVTAGQVLAKMDTDVLEAQLREAQARLEEAQIAVGTAKAQVAQREAEKAAAEAVVSQRAAEYDAAQKRFARTEELAKQRISSIQDLDDDRAQAAASQAAVSAAKAQVAASDAAIGAARSQVVRAQADVEAARATIQRIQADLDDSQLKSPRDGRVQYRIAEPGEVLAAGGRVLNLVDLADVYMTFFLPTAAAGRVALGADVHLVLDALPQVVIPAKATFVADVAQFTPKSVETEEERLKLMFRVKAHIDPDLLRRNIRQVKTGLPGMAYVRLDPEAQWPRELEVRLPQRAADAGPPP
jgi:HlyD family secretion protein